MGMAKIAFGPVLMWSGLRAGDARKRFPHRLKIGREFYTKVREVLRKGHNYSKVDDGR